MDKTDFEKNRILQKNLQEQGINTAFTFTKRAIFNSMDEYARGKTELLKACQEFVRKVECSEARNVKSYEEMKEAIKIATIKSK